MGVVQVDIQNAQSDAKAKDLINRYFNMCSYITTIHGTNMNLGISQCKNCWKWDHTIFSCCVHRAKCIKYNGSYKTEHHHHFCGVTR